MSWTHEHYCRHPQPVTGTASRGTVRGFRQSTPGPTDQLQKGTGLARPALAIQILVDSCGDDRWFFGYWSFRFLDRIESEHGLGQPPAFTAIGS